MTENLDSLAIQIKNVSPPQKTARAENRAKKDSSYYDSLEEKYLEFTKGNELLTISEALDAAKTRTIFLLTINIAILRLLGG